MSIVPRSSYPRANLPVLAASWPLPQLGRIGACGLPFALPLALLGLWQLAATRAWVAVQILPPPVMVLGTLRDLIADGTILGNLEISLTRIGIGLGLGVLAGLIFGLLLGLSARAEQYLGPIFRAVALVPSLGWLPILILVFGIGEPLKYLIIAKASFVPMALATANGVRSIPGTYREAGRVLRLGRTTILFRLLLPATLPAIFMGLRLSIGSAWVALVVVEMLAATEGVGYMMTWGRTLFQTDVVLAGMLVIGILGAIVDLGTRRLERHIQPGSGIGTAIRTAPPRTSLAILGLNIDAAVLRGLLVPVLLIGGWVFWTSAIPDHNRLIVPPSQVLGAPFLDPIGQGLWLDLGRSLARLGIGIAIGIATGLLLGLGLGMSRTVERAIGPTFYALRQVTVFAWIPLLTAWFGAEDLAKIVFIALSAFFPMVTCTHDGLRAVPDRLREVAAVARLSWHRRVRLLMVPAALPGILVGLELATMHGWIGTVGAEYAMGLGQGLGTFIEGGREQFRMDIVLLGVLALGVVGYGLNLILRRALRGLSTAEIQR
ncbi:MAG TPA: ABC transporter permease subunit [Stellaceae bacterium]|nr:ABC transporter permease subunit [Stellaceae bacterium]